MSIKVIDGDLLKTNAKYICHQVNCKGKMGSGIAKQIRAKYPEVYMVGIPQFVQCYDGKIVINMFAQQSYGYDGRQYTSYEAFEKCLEGMAGIIPTGETIAMPFMIGCGLGGGNWEIIADLIIEKLCEKYTVEFWRLPK